MSSTIVVVNEGNDIFPEVNKIMSTSGWRLAEADIRSIAASLSHENPEAVIYISREGEVKDCKAVLDAVMGFDDNLPLIVIARIKDVESVIEIMKAGAYDFFPVPVDKTRFKSSVEHSISLYNLTKRVFLLENQMGLRDGFDNIIGSSSRMQEVFSTLQMVAKSNATALILGESGTGKELVAKAIHKHSSRAGKVFMDINCGAIPSELLENEMFGHEKGAYTGADRRYIGSFERAHSGTIFLDEISEMSPNLQVKLLRFLQERNFTRVGGTEPIEVDVRIIAATNRDLSRLVAEGLFREDLYYRLNVVPISIPPLRQRKEDIPVLVRFFLQKISAKNEKIFLDVAPKAMEALVSYDWPGNVRELENTMERVVVLHNDTKVKMEYLPPAILEAYHKSDARVLIDENQLHQGKIIPLELVERYAIESALRQCLGNVAEASTKLRIGQATLYRKIRQYGLKA